MPITEQPVRIDEVVGLTEAGKQAGLTAETIKRYLDRGVLRGAWVAGRRVVVRSDLERFIRERRASRR